MATNYFKSASEQADFSYTPGSELPSGGYAAAIRDAMVNENNIETLDEKLCFVTSNLLSGERITTNLNNIQFGATNVPHFINWLKKKLNLSDSALHIVRFNILTYSEGYSSTAKKNNSSAYLEKISGLSNYSYLDKFKGNTGCIIELKHENIYYDILIINSLYVYFSKKSIELSDNKIPIGCLYSLEPFSSYKAVPIATGLYNDVSYGYPAMLGLSAGIVESSVTNEWSQANLLPIYIRDDSGISGHELGIGASFLYGSMIGISATEE